MCIGRTDKLTIYYVEETQFGVTRMKRLFQNKKKALDLSQNEQEMVEHIILQMEEESGLDRAAAIADMHFGFIGKVCDETVVKPKESKECLPAFVGKSQGFPPESVYSHFCGNHCYLVFANL